MADAASSPALAQSRSGTASSVTLAWPTLARTLWLPIALAGLAFAIRISVGPLTIDDAYITFRYAQNIADGLGFVYNPGQHVIGTTTPLYTMLLALAYRLGIHDLPRLAVILASLADAGTTALTYWVARRFGFDRRWASLSAVLFAICGLSVAYAAGGMETSLFTLLVVSALAAEMADRRLLTGILEGLALLTRPEGALVLVLIVGRRLLVCRAIPWRVVLPAAAIYLPWLVYAYWWTGSIFSESVVAKASAYGEAWPVAVSMILKPLSAPGLDSGYNVVLYTQILFHIELIVLLLGLLVSMFALAHSRRFVRLLRAQPTWCPLLLFGPLLVTAYLLAGARGVRRCSFIRGEFGNVSSDDPTRRSR